MSLTFNGNSANYASKAITFSAGKGTVMAWVRIVTDTNDYTTFFQTNNTDNEQFVLQTDATGTLLSCYIYNSSVTGTDLSASTWHHLALTWDGTSARAYINGTLDITVTATGSTWNEVRLGRSWWGEPLNGNIGIVKAFDATLTAEQIQQEMNTIRPVDPTSLVLWMPTFPGASERLLDYSGRGNALTATGTLTDSDNPPVSWGGPTWLYPYVGSAVAQNITADTISATAAVYAPTLSHSLVVGTIATSATVHSPTIARGAASVAADTIGTGASVPNPTVTRGAIAVTTDTIASSAAVYSPTLHHSVTAGTIASGASVYAPTLTAPYALVAGTIGSAASVFAPTVHHSVTVGTIASSAAVYNPTFTRGAASVIADTIGSGSSVYVPVFSGSGTLVADAIASTATIYNPTITTGVVNVTAAQATSDGSVYAPVVTATAAIVVGTIGSSETVYAPTVSTSGSSVTADAIGSGAAVYSPTATTGAVAISADTITSTATVYTPNVIGSIQIVSPDLVVSGETHYAPVVLPIPTFIAAASHLSGPAVTSRAPAVPTGTVDGDLMLALVMVESSAPGITPPAGWIELWNTPLSNRSHTQVLYYRVASSEPADYTWTWSSAEGAAAILTYRNAAEPTLYGNQVNNSQTTAVAAAALTITANGSMAVWLGTSMSGSTWTPPVGYTERLDARTSTASTNMGMSAAERYFQVATATGTVAGTSSMADYNIGGLVILAPAAASTSQNVTSNFIAGSSAFYAVVASPGAVTYSPALLSLTATVYGAVVTQTIYADTIASVATTYAPTTAVSTVSLTAGFISATTVVRVPEVKTRATIGGVLYVDPTNGRYFRTSAGIVVLAGFHTWYTLWDGDTAEPVDPFDYTAWLNYVDGRGGNWHKLWAMESARDWDDAVAYFSAHYYARPGPGTAADGKPKFDVTQLNQAYFDRLRQRVIEAGNRGHYVTVPFFQGWQIDQHGINGGSAWSYHPFKSGNNINGLSGDLNSDGDGREVHSTAAPAGIITAQRLYVAKVLDTLNDLDNVIYEISNEDNSVATSKQWQWDLVAYCQTYESGLTKQHPVGMTHIWFDTIADLTGSGADWISHSNNNDMSTPLTTDGTFVSAWDTDHVVGLVYDHYWVWKAFLRGNNPWFMDEYDGAGNLYGTDYRNNSASEKIRYNLGYVLDYAARIDLATATPQNALASTGYCLAKTTGTAKILAYQPTSGSFTVDLTSLTGAFAVEWLRTNTGTIQTAANISGGAVRTLTPPWANEDAVVFIQKIANEILPSLLTSAGSVYAPVVTRGAVSVTAGTVGGVTALYAPTVAPDHVHIGVNAIGAETAVFAPTVTVGHVDVEVEHITGSASVYAPTLSVGALSLTADTIAGAATVYDTDVTRGAVTIAAGTATSTSEVYIPQILRGGLVYAPETVTLASEVYTPTLTVGAVTSLPVYIGSELLVYNPDITPATWPIAFDFLAPGETVFAPAVSLGVWNIAPDELPSAAIFYAPSVTVGAPLVSTDTIASAEAVPAPIVTRGSVTVTPDTIASTEVFYSLITTAGFVFVFPNLASGGSSVFAPVVTYGTSYIAASFVASGATVHTVVISETYALTAALVTSSGQVFAPTVTARIAVALDNVPGSTSIHAPTVTRGDATVTASLIPSSGTVHAPAITRGAVSITADTVAASGQVFAVTVVNLSVMVFPATIPASGQVFGAAVSPGTATIAPPFITSSVNFAAPVVSPWTALTYPNFVPSAAVVRQPLVTVGALGITPNFRTSTLTVRQPTITRGAVAVTADGIDTPGQVFPVTITTGALIVTSPFSAPIALHAPTITRGPVQVVVDRIESGTALYAPVVSPWTALLVVAFVGGSAQVYTPAVTLPPYIVGLDAIAATATVAQPYIQTGFITVPVDAIASSGIVYGVAVEHGLRQYVYANQIASSLQLYTTVVMVLLAQRVLRVSREIRTVDIKIGREQRRTHFIE